MFPLFLDILAVVVHPGCICPKRNWFAICMFRSLAMGWCLMFPCCGWRWEWWWWWLCFSMASFIIHQMMGFHHSSYFLVRQWMQMVPDQNLWDTADKWRSWQEWNTNPYQLLQTRHPQGFDTLMVCYWYDPQQLFWTRDEKNAWDSIQRWWIPMGRWWNWCFSLVSISNRTWDAAKTGSNRKSGHRYRATGDCSVIVCWECSGLVSTDCPENPENPHDDQQPLWLRTCQLLKSTPVLLRPDGEGMY